MLAERLAAQLLTGPPARDPIAVTRRLLAVQAQDPRGARLAIRARSSGLTAGDVDRALTEERSLLITWLNRGTLHLVHREDYQWLQVLTTPPLFTANARRLRQEGVTAAAADRGVRAIERALEDEGPLTRAQLRERVAAIGVPVAGQALVHLLLLASLRGLVVRGPMVGSEQAFVLVRNWLEVSGGAGKGGGIGRGTRKGRAIDREQALAELARRYLEGHGPADERDLAKWAGLSLRDARAGLAAIASELDDRTDGLVDLLARAHPPDLQLPPPRLLGAFDPLLLGWRSRAAILGAHTGVVTVNGIFRPIALVAGRAVATWRMPAAEVVLEPFAQLSRQHAEALERDAQDVARYLARAP